MEKTVVVDKVDNNKVYIDRLSIEVEETESFTAKTDLFCYIIAGYGLMSIESYGYSFEPEVGVYIPKGTEYKLTNTGDVNFEIVSFGVQ